MEHYFCQGECGGVAKESGTCQAVDCSCHGQELVSCGCGEEAHNKTKSEDHKEEKGE